VHATCLSQQDAEIAILFEDVTRRRKEQERLRISEARFRAIQETSIDGFMVLESVRETGRIVDFVWIYANDTAAAIIGKHKSWFDGKRLLEEMPGNRDEGLFDAYVRVVETGEPWVNELKYRHEGIDIYIRLVAAKADDGFAVTFSDLSVRRRAEEAARESEARLAAALKAGQLGVHEYKVVSGEIEWDQVVRSLWGVSERETITYETFANGVHPDDMPAVSDAVLAALDPSGNGHYISEYRVIHRTTGETRWVVAEGQTTFVRGRPDRCPSSGQMGQ
jgi:PAS domain-containing protein